MMETNKHLMDSGCALVVELLQRGFTLRVEGDNLLQVGPAHLITPELRETITIHKSAIITIQKMARQQWLAEEWRDG